jgi:hypothetical protein
MAAHYGEFVQLELSSVFDRNTHHAHGSSSPLAAQAEVQRGRDWPLCLEFASTTNQTVQPFNTSTPGGATPAPAQAGCHH